VLGPRLAICTGFDLVRLIPHKGNKVGEQIVIVFLVHLHETSLHRFDAALSILDGGDLCEQPVLVAQDGRIVLKKLFRNLGLLFADSAWNNASPRT
jgi:hypothetical protein